ncbi:hypothetical protein IHE45_20G036400 [Dioscorea alata]|uniref:Uncharacterized protein n=1 Tax=Dioscorea alata TaxID=55571 RepID=A0ACB7TV70_DIOAL|nr:hypothetical protein IHE45_20G036400 [Dioscorea alata]
MSGTLEQKKSHKGYIKLVRQWSLPSNISTSDDKKKKKIKKKKNENEANYKGAIILKSKGQNASSSGCHPVLKAMQAPNFDKALMKPEFLRYLDYLKEAGTWDPNSSSPIIYFK